MSEDRLSIKLQALADPTRRAMLARLRQGEATVSELAQPFEMSLPAISKHIKVLQQAGLITRSRHAQQRPCQLSPEALREVDDWMKAYRDVWEDRLDRLDTYLKTVKE
ncbi:MAG: metalloregulator ArsR/SmtB family transcription factor [Aestuariivirga sp.]